MNAKLPALSVLACLTLPALASARAAPQEPAHDGRSLSEWAADLDGDDEMARRRAVSAIGDIAAQGEKAAAAAWPHLLGALDDPYDGVRWQAVNELRMRGALVGEAAVAAAPPRLFALLEDPQWTVRQVTLDALVTLAPAHPDLGAALLRALEDPESGVRGVAAGALARTAPPEVSVPLLVALVDDSDWQVAVRAVQELGGLGEAAAPAVERILALHTAPPEGLDERKLVVVRTETAEALGAIGPAARSAVPALQQALRSDDERVRRSAGQALVSIGEPGDSVFVFADALASGDAWRKREALEQLEKMGPVAAPALGAVIRALGDTEAQVRWSAASAIAAMGSAAAPAVPALINSLGDSESLVRDNALGALAAVGPGASPQVLPALAAALDDERLSRRALEALASIGPAAAPVAGQLAGRLGHPDLGYGAQKALVAIGAPAAPALAAALDEPIARERALRALAELGPAAAAALPRLIPLLGEDESRFHAVEIVGAVGGEALGPLREALGSDDAKQRAGAAEALARLGAVAVPAIPDLIALLADEEAGYHATRALAAIGEPAIPAIAARLGADGIEGFQAGTALQGIGVAAVPALAEAIASDDPAARRNAAFALQRLGPDAAAAVPALEAALAHEDTRSFVERALAAIRGE